MEIDYSNAGMMCEGDELNTELDSVIDSWTIRDGDQMEVDEPVHLLAEDLGAIQLDDVVDCEFALPLCAAIESSEMDWSASLSGMEEAAMDVSFDYFQCDTGEVASLSIGFNDAVTDFALPLLLRSPVMEEVTTSNWSDAIYSFPASDITMESFASPIFILPRAQAAPATIQWQAPKVGTATQLTTSVASKAATIQTATQLTTPVASKAATTRTATQLTTLVASEAATVRSATQLITPVASTSASPPSTSTSSSTATPTSKAKKSSTASATLATSASTSTSTTTSTSKAKKSSPASATSPTSASASASTSKVKKAAPSTPTIGTAESDPKWKGKGKGVIEEESTIDEPEVERKKQKVVKEVTRKIVKEASIAAASKLGHPFDS